VYQSKKGFPSFLEEEGRVKRLYAQWEKSLTYADEMQDTDPLGYEYLVPQDKAYVPLVQQNEDFDYVGVDEYDSLIRKFPRWEHDDQTTFSDAGVVTSIFGKIICVSDPQSYLDDREYLRQVFINGGWPSYNNAVLEEVEYKEFPPTDYLFGTLQALPEYECACGDHASDYPAMLAQAAFVQDRRLFAWLWSLPTGLAEKDPECIWAASLKIDTCDFPALDSYITEGPWILVVGKVYALLGQIFPGEIIDKIFDSVPFPFVDIPPMTVLPWRVMETEMKVGLMRQTCLPYLYVHQDRSHWEYVLWSPEPLKKAYYITPMAMKSFVHAWPRTGQRGYVYKLRKRRPGPFFLYIMGMSDSAFIQVAAYATHVAIQWNQKSEGDMKDFFLCGVCFPAYDYVAYALKYWHYRETDSLFYYCPVRKRLKYAVQGYYWRYGLIGENEIARWQKRLRGCSIILNRRELHDILTIEGFKPVGPQGIYYGPDEVQWHRERQMKLDDAGWDPFSTSQ